MFAISYGLHTITHVIPAKKDAIDLSGCIMPIAPSPGHLRRNWRSATQRAGGMIVQPDFADHWKTDTLVRLSGSESSVRCLLRFWSHCQNRRQWRFNNVTPEILASICKWTGDAKTFWSAMTQTFLEERENNVLVAHEWELINATLLARWKGGKATQKKWSAKAQPKLSQGDKRRVEKSREDKKGLEKMEPRASAEGVDLSGLSGPIQSRFLDWIKFRKGMGKKPGNWTELFTEQVAWLSKFQESNQSEILSQSIRNGWQGLFELKGKNGERPPSKPKPKFVDRTGETEEQMIERQRDEARRKLGANWV